MNIRKENDGTIIVEGASILPGSYRNFTGAPDSFNPAGGKRYFNFVIDDPETAQQMREDGWNVKIKPPREEGDTPFCYLKVAVAFPKPGSKARPLDISMFKSNGVNRLNEDTVGLLDGAFITSANMAIRPYHWESAGNSGIAAYVQELHVWVKEDYLSNDYDGFDDEPPFTV